VVPLDARAVARALEQLLTEPARWEAASRAARELVRARYQWPDIAIRTLELYGKILNSQPAPSH
jgi:glycosyltransferase involved in cell wall biosynthesis